MKAIQLLSAGGLALALSSPLIAATLPQPKTEHGITYVNGGIGEDESTAMKAEAKHYPLSLILSAGKDGEYLADVPVTIRNSAGKAVLQAHAGPILLIKAPPGTYRIAATRHGKTLEQTVVVTAKGERQVSLHWPKA